MTTKPRDHADWYSAKDVASLTRLGRSSAYLLMHELGGVSVGQRSLRVRRDALEAWMRKQERTNISAYRARRAG